MLLGKAYFSSSQHLDSHWQSKYSVFPEEASAEHVDCVKCCTKPTVSYWPSETKSKEMQGFQLVTEKRSYQKFKATFIVGHCLMVFCKPKGLGAIPVVL